MFGVFRNTRLKNNNAMFKKTSFLSLILLFILNVNAQNYIYVGDSGLNNLRKIDLDGNFIETIDEDINTPREIEVDYENGIIFYTNAFDDSSIRKYNFEH